VTALTDSGHPSARTNVRGFQATALIDATPAQVWRVLSDVAHWPDWDSGVTKVEGQLALGETLKISVEGNTGRTFPVKVMTLSDPDRMVFRGGMPLRLFTGERVYTLQHEDGRTLFTMREQYAGPLSPLIFKSIPDLGPSFERFAAGLKRRVE
jgi:uncharacterized protein YndB with AHSA1/START domain